jgi:hypothetical protein
MFRHVLENLGRHAWGSRDWVLEGFLRKVKGHPQALLHVLETPVDTSRDELAAISVPTLVIQGSADEPEAAASSPTCCRTGRSWRCPATTSPRPAPPSSARRLPTSSADPRLGAGSDGARAAHRDARGGRLGPGQQR